MIGACLRVISATVAVFALALQPDPAIHVTARLTPPKWALLERQLLAANVPALREFYSKYFDDRG